MRNLTLLGRLEIEANREARNGRCSGLICPPHTQRHGSKRLMATAQSHRQPFTATPSLNHRYDTTKSIQLFFNGVLSCLHSQKAAYTALKMPCEYRKYLAADVHV